MSSSCSFVKSGFSRVMAALLLLGAAATATAGGPRWISGPPFFNTWRTSVSWYTTHPMYFTDPGDLSPSVNHAAADAMVAQAAAVWNIQTASLVLAQGGVLNQHLSSANVYASASGPVFPADVQATNYLAKQIAVIYDSDGSVTDLLLGSGASDPSGCLQAGVTESADLITPGAQIEHALLILNGRCTGPEPEKQLQMQYQLMRAFGRILGLGWSQVNDNVFTGSPLATHTQALNWPIMHPIDIVCGPYSYQCLPQPFTLRPDDISSLQSLYFISPGQAQAGKVPSWSNAAGAWGFVNFPNGQGMQGVNVVVRRRAAFWDIPEDWQTASSVSGYSFRGQSATSIAAPGTSAQASMGAPWTNYEGYWRIQSIPIPPSQDWLDLIVTTEPINPLYTGAYAIGSQVGDTVSPSGAPESQVSGFLAVSRDNLTVFTPQDAAPSCATQSDGSEGAPAPASQQGWWTGTICGYQHQAWNSLQVKSNRTLTFEITATDEQGAVSMTKAMPIVGVWNANDAPGTLPTIASAATAFNSMSVGMTSLRVPSSTVPTTLRFAIADQRGDGRPDFGYQARALYADAVTPANVSSDGGTVTITGMGFRQGNSVLVNGVAANVVSWTATSIVATVPPLHALGLSRTAVASITVKDVSTGGSSVMTGALSYAAPVESLQLLSAPSGALAAGTAAITTFSVKAIAPDGFTPIVGEAVSFTAAGATLSPCDSASCTVLTNSAGIAAASVTPAAPGNVTLTATGRSGTATASFTATATTDVLHLVSAPTGVTTTGTAAGTFLRVQLLSSDGVAPKVGARVVVTVPAGLARLSACSAVPCALTTDASGYVTTTVTPMSSGSISVQFASVSSTVVAVFSAAAESMQLKSAPAATQTTGAALPVPFSIKLLAGDGVTPVGDEAVVLTASGAPAYFAACGGSVCTVTSNSRGLVESSVTVTGAGPVTLTAMGNAGAVTAAFTAVTPPDILQTVSAPGSTVYLDDSPSSFAVRITTADGVTPVVGKEVSFSATAGAVRFGACGAQTCTVLTDFTGLASTQVGVLAAGPIALQAASDAGSTTAAFTAAVRIRSVTVSKPVQYVAEGIAFTWEPQVLLTDSSAGAGNVPVSWINSPGVIFASNSSRSEASGAASGSVTAGPLAAGARVQGSACAWVTICATVAAQGVGAAEWRLEYVSGATQSVSVGDSLAPVVLQVVNATGDPVAGVSVQVEQTLSSWEAACPVSGRCPQPATLSASRSSAVSDADGLIRVQPAQMNGVPSITRLAFVAGLEGFATLSLETHP